MKMKNGFAFVFIFSLEGAEHKKGRTLMEYLPFLTELSPRKETGKERFPLKEKGELYPNLKDARPTQIKARFETDLHLS